MNKFLAVGWDSPPPPPPPILSVSYKGLREGLQSTPGVGNKATSKEETFFVRRAIQDYNFFELLFTPCEAEQSLQGMELQEKETQKD